MKVRSGLHGAAISIHPIDEDIDKKTSREMLAREPFGELK
jgi:hypothetical protein